MGKHCKFPHRCLELHGNNLKKDVHTVEYKCEIYMQIISITFIIYAKQRQNLPPQLLCDKMALVMFLKCIFPIGVSLANKFKLMLGLI